MLEIYFLVFTRRSRSVFPYLYGVLKGERHGVRQHHTPRHHGTHRTATQPPGHRTRTDTTHTTRTHARPKDGLHTHPHTPAPTARGQRTPTGGPEDRQPGEGERLNPDAPRNGAMLPPRGRPPASPTARNKSTQECTVWCQCWVPTPTPTPPGKQGPRNPAWPPEGTGGQGKGQRLTRNAAQNSRRPPPPRNALRSPPRHAAPHRACRLKGTVPVPHTHTPGPTEHG